MFLHPASQNKAKLHNHDNTTEKWHSPMPFQCAFTLNGSQVVDLASQRVDNGVTKQCHKVQRVEDRESSICCHTAVSRRVENDVVGQCHKKTVRDIRIGCVLA